MRKNCNYIKKKIFNKIYKNKNLSKNDLIKRKRLRI